MKYQFIADQCSGISVEKMCRFLKVSRGGYYRWQNHVPGQREQDNERLLEKIKKIFKKGRKVYGSPRIHAELNAEGETCGRKRVARIMKDHGIKAKTKRKFKCTTDSEHQHPIAPNLVEQRFLADDINQLWLSDITYIWTQEGWLYLAAILDVHSRKIVGWSLKTRLYKEIVTEAIHQALGRRQIMPDTIFHSDRGSQYASHEVSSLLKEKGFKQSMSGKGNCYDNAMMESFFHTLKTELVHDRRFATRDEAKQCIFDYIEIFYNRERRHSGINYMTPAQFEQSIRSKLLLAA